MKTMQAVVFRGKDRLELEDVPKPTARAGQAVIRITTTTICGTDVHTSAASTPSFSAPVGDFPRPKTFRPRCCSAL